MTTFQPIGPLVLLMLIGTSAAHAQTATPDDIIREFHVRRSINYPKEALDAGVQGRVDLELTVDTLCRITGKRVVNGLGHGLDEAALKQVGRKFEQGLIRNFKYCTPGALIIPVTFRIPE